MMVSVVVVLYSLSLLFLFLFSLGQLHLAWHYRQSLKKQPSPLKAFSSSAELPAVTIQLPLYNERYVAERLLEAITALDYPAEKLEIQVLDDSTDDTSSIIAAKITVLGPKGLNIRHIRREKREGFKAGALQDGLQQAKGDFLAIFDADFLPQPDFLQKTIPYFVDKEVGVVQTRWGHLNRNYSLLTRLQAFGLDAHFTVEQGGRSHANSFINFNGTGGIWRKSCIEEAGGWSADTLTEDLDLSYRAQMKGWKFRYLEAVEAPAELPVLMPAIKSQHFRWNKGAAECARKNLWKVLRSPERKPIHKVHALFHLLNSSIFIAILLAALLSIPMLFLKAHRPELNWLFHAGSIFLLGFLSIALFYWMASRRLQPEHTGRYFWSLFPPFLIISMGLAAHNTMAVAEGWLGKKSSFIRTPKFNIRKKGDSWADNIYIRPQFSWLSLLEGLLCLYFIFGVGAGIYLQDYALLLFHSMLATGFGLVFYYSLR
ncbi:cellulose synthase family protein [Nafulsella turpanensis]|uniref:cellulose synthase family protein n=1 Tax=Nafulsella turpanensis TaxID=1265690 RepID=UPI00034B5085|nr:cellulose synthase family protein [Nafulsella turpanensis]